MKSKLMEISCYLSNKFIKEDIHFQTTYGALNTVIMRSSFGNENLLFCLLIISQIDYLKEYICHLNVNNEYIKRYFGYDFMNKFMQNVGKWIKHLNQNPSMLLTQEQIKAKIKFDFNNKRKKKDSFFRKESISKLLLEKKIEHEFKEICDEFLLNKEFLEIYNKLISFNCSFSFHSFQDFQVII